MPLGSSQPHLGVRHSLIAAHAVPCVVPSVQANEIANLMGVVRELTESRSKAASQRASLAERYNDLQSEYHRVLRIADLSRTVRCGRARRLAPLLACTSMGRLN